MKNKLNKIKTSFGLPRFSSTSSAFTIIELLVVIAVIAALAAITVIAYVGVTSQAHKVALSSGLSESVKALENYKTTNGITSSETYPTKLSDMTNLKLDNSINWTYYVPSTTDNTQNTSYCLQGTVNGITQSVSSTDSSVQTKPCLENGLVGWWKLNGNANDSSGNNNNGTINGGVTTATGEDGVAGHAYSFDGTSGYISVNDSSTIDLTNGGGSISLWIKSSTTTNGTQGGSLVGKASNAYTNGYWVYLRDSKAGLSLFGPTLTNGQYIQFKGNYSIVDGTWHNIVIAYSNNHVSIYVDNNLYAASDLSFAFSTTKNDKLYIARFTAPGEGYYNGLIDDARIYTRALSPNEISVLYSAGAQ